MTEEAVQQAEQYVKKSLDSQRKLGYSAKVDADTYNSAVAETARAVDKMLKVQRASQAHA